LAELTAKIQSPNPNPNDLFSIAAQILDYNKIRIKLQNSIAVNRN